MNRMQRHNKLPAFRGRGSIKIGFGGPAVSSLSMLKPHFQRLFDTPSIRFGSSWELHPRHGQEETNTIIAFAAKKLECGDAVNTFVEELSPEAADSLLKSLLLRARTESFKYHSDIMFSKLDENKDGVLTKEEFMRLATAAAEESAQPVESPTYKQVLFKIAW